jgi:hypothetical protein
MSERKPTPKERRRELVKLHLLDEHLIAIGHIGVRAAVLDEMIVLTAGQVIRNYPKTLREEADLFSTPKKLRLIKDALIEDMPESKHAISEFISDIEAVRYERNDIMHRIWRATEAPEIKELVQLQLGEPEKSIRRVSSTGMMSLANKMVDLTFELADWKTRSTQIRQRRFAASAGIRPPLPALPNAPRVSVKDIEKLRERQARQRTD